MKGGTRIAMGVGIGYLLGRTRKMRFALSLAGAAMARRNTGMPAELLERGTSLLKSSPELTQLTDTVRGELLGAVRSAAVTATSNRLDALNDRLQQGATLVADRDRDEREKGSDEDEDEPLRNAREASADEDEDLTDEDDSGTDRDEDDERRHRSTARAGSPRSARTRKTSSRTSERTSRSADRKPASSVRRRTSADADQAPVRRTRR